MQSAPLPETTTSRLLSRGAGVARLYLGGPTGLGATLVWTITTCCSDDSLGGALAGQGDLNGDGFSDLLVQAHDGPPGVSGPLFGGVAAYLGNGGAGAFRGA